MCNEADLGERLTLTGQGGGRQRRRVGGMESLQPGPLQPCHIWEIRQGRSWRESLQEAGELSTEQRQRPGARLKPI